MYSVFFALCSFFILPHKCFLSYFFHILISNTRKKYEIREYILKENKEEAESQMKKVMEKWEERYKTLAFYIEHDELEKVETEMVKLETDIEVEEFKHCVSELETIIFILEHIQEKEEMHFRSVF